MTPQRRERQREHQAARPEAGQSKVKVKRLIPKQRGGMEEEKRAKRMQKKKEREVKRKEEREEMIRKGIVKTLNQPRLGKRAEKQKAI